MLPLGQSEGPDLRARLRDGALDLLRQLGALARHGDGEAPPALVVEARPILALGAAKGKAADEAERRGRG